MKNSYKFLASLAVLAVVGSLSIASLASADEADDGEWPPQCQFDDATREEMQAMHNEMRQNHEEMRAAMDDVLATGDYQTWYDYVSEQDHPRAEMVLEIVTEDNFDTFIEMHEAMQEHDMETAHELADELGLKGHEASQGPHSKMNGQMQQRGDA